MSASWLVSSVLLVSLAAGSADAQSPQVLLYGDSLTTGTAGDPGFAPRLTALGWDTEDRAMSGQPRATGVVVLENDLATARITAANEAAVLFWGSNDLEGFANLNPDCLAQALSYWRCHFAVVRDAFVTQVEAIRALGVGVIVAFPPPQYVAQGAELRNMDLEFTRFLVKRALEDLAVPIIDFYDEFLAMPNPVALMSADGLHLNDFGDLYLTVRVDQVLRDEGLSPP